MGVLDRYYQLTKQGAGATSQDSQPMLVQYRQPMQARYSQPLQTESVQVQPEQPLVDSSDAIGSLVNLLGPTPAEREARERRMQENKSKMAAWTGLFDGLRQLGNLYYTAQGAAPQRYGDNPYQQIEQNYQTQRQVASDLDNYRRQYAQQLYNWQRQGALDERSKMLAKAQAKYYDTRDEMARLKAENDKLKNEAAIRATDARTKNTEAKTATEEATREKRLEEMDSRIKRNQQTGAAAIIRANKTGGGRSGGGRSGTYGYRTVKHVGPATGDVITERVPTTGSGSRAAGNLLPGNNTHNRRSGSLLPK